MIKEKMLHLTPFETNVFFIFLMVIFSFGCNGDPMEKEGPPSTSGVKIRESSSSPMASEAKEKTLAEASMAEPAGADGVLRQEADFWNGLPNAEESEIYSTLAAGTKVTVLRLKNGYYKVAHQRLTGYIKRNLVKIVKPESVPEAGSTVISGSPSLAKLSSTGKESAEASPDNAPEAAASGITPCRGAIGEELLPGVSCVQYREKVLEKVNALQIYIERIIDKTEVNRQKSVDMACRLFVNEQAMVIATSLNSPSSARPIRKYLNGLMAMSYDKVEIEWTNIQYISDLRRGPDGKYFGFVHIEQKFKGFLDGRLIYGDVTEKIMTVVLETYEVVDPMGNSNTRWDIFLSDIGVVQTKKLG
jgi:hypothetical protein